MLASSLVTVKQNAKSLKVKLTDKQTPCITLDMEFSSTDSTQSRRCVHDIPVEVIPRKYWTDYAEPQFTEFHVVKYIILLFINLHSSILRYPFKCHL